MCPFVEGVIFVNSSWKDVVSPDTPFSRVSFALVPACWLQDRMHGFSVVFDLYEDVAAVTIVVIAFGPLSWTCGW